MEPHLPLRPSKRIFEIPEQERLRKIAIEKIKELLFPNKKILKIILIGSSVKGTFGKYEEPGFRGSLFSDFDFIVFVKDSYEIPDSLEREPNGKPFEDEGLNLAYRKRKWIEETYDAEIFFIRESSIRIQNVQLFAEQAGIPLNIQSQNPFFLIYEAA
ncbi:MAG: hypothetical protein Q7R83_04110 [bacterium]|nr:hypothetical protein [bacterium]